MKSLVIVFSILLIASGNLYSQAKFRKLPSSINHPALNLYTPFISADGNALVFISDNAEDHVLTPFFSYRGTADWSEPKELPKTIYSRLNFLRGFALNADGSKLYYSTLKGPGVGGFDLWVSEWNGSSWSPPVNLTMPINSKENEGCPSVTVDGKTMYFMRCPAMDHDKAENCRLYMVRKKPNGQWDEPIELPANINTGNSQTPRIMADGQTLIFASDRMPNGKGGMDLYMTRLVNENWTTPKPLDFVNTDKDDQYVSATAIGRYLVRDQMGARKSELVEILFPDEVRPKSMCKVIGTVNDLSGMPVPSYISIEDLVARKTYYRGRPETDGSFTVYLREGSRYELSVDPEQDHLTYYTRQFDLTGDRIPQVEKIAVSLETLEEGDSIRLDMFTFKPYSSELEMTGSEGELRRLMRLVNSNPEVKFEVQVILEGYVQDSIQSDPDLTEVIYDSTYTIYDDIDSLGQLYQRDTLLIDTIYHNDRTLRQAEAIVQYFLQQGAKEENFSYSADATPGLLDEKRLTIRAVVRKRD